MVASWRGRAILRPVERDAAGDGGRPGRAATPWARRAARGAGRLPSRCGRRASHSQSNVRGGCRARCHGGPTARGCRDHVEGIEQGRGASTARMTRCGASSGSRTPARRRRRQRGEWCAPAPGGRQPAWAYVMQSVRTWMMVGDLGLGQDSVALADGDVFPGASGRVGSHAGFWGRGGGLRKAVPFPGLSPGNSPLSLQWLAIGITLFPRDELARRTVSHGRDLFAGGDQRRHRGIGEGHLQGNWRTPATRPVSAA